MPDVIPTAHEAAWTPENDAAVGALVARHRAASGGLMRAVIFFGRKAENFLDGLPDDWKSQIDRATSEALHSAYGAANSISRIGLPDPGSWANSAAVTVSGAVGGFAGLASAIVELPFAVTTMFGSIQRIAASHGFNPEDEATRLECLLVFGSGGPLEDDNGIDTSFLASRVALSGAGVHAVIATVAPRFAMVLGQKLAAQSVPVLGALAGAGVNLAFIRYFEAMAEVRFGLARLSAERGRERVTAEFRRLAADGATPS